ncbi:hypothetical protein [Planctomicrobium sp. SH664]|uniref:hypothetical protein n=1 Tax=Planctomicrobium sp. SH664 TaxID=3448125 RepID=UPI003F5B7D08
MNPLQVLLSLLTILAILLPGSLVSAVTGPHLQGTSAAESAPFENSSSESEENSPIEPIGSHSRRLQADEAIRRGGLRCASGPRRTGHQQAQRGALAPASPHRPEVQAELTIAPALRLALQQVFLL